MPGCLSTASLGVGIMTRWPEQAVSNRVHAKIKPVRTTDKLLIFTLFLSISGQSDSQIEYLFLYLTGACALVARNRRV